MCETYGKAVSYDRMVKNKSDDELGLFEKYDEILSEIRNRIIKYKATNVIDIGCGTGNLCGKLSEKAYVLGIDQSLEMITYAKKKYPKMNFALGSFLDRPTKKNAADIVVTTYAFHALNDEEKKTAVKNMLDYIKDDGKIIIVDFMFADDIDRELCKNNLYAKDRQDLWTFINSKYYTNLEQFNKYIKLLNCKMHADHIVNFTWIIEITSN